MTHDGEMTLCQSLAIADCLQALEHDKCPGDCGSCIYHLAFKLDEANYTVLRAKLGIEEEER